MLFRSTSGAGCTSTCNRTLIVNQLPSCDISGNTTICAGGSTSFTATGGGTYSWSGPGGFSAATAGTGPISAAGLYTVVVTSGAGCTSTCNRTLTVNPLPVVSCSANPSLIDITSLAHNSQLAVDLTGSADTDPTHYTYLWTEDGAGSFDANNISNPVYTAGILDAGGTVNFTITVTNTITGCSNSQGCSLNVSAGGSCPQVPTSSV